MTNLYPAQFQELFVEVYDAGYPFQQSNGFFVSFRDVPEALTQGDNFADALDMAQDGLSVAMEFYDEDNKPRPKPSEPQYGDVMIILLPDAPKDIDCEQLIPFEM